MRFDTGADITVFPASLLFADSITEADFTKWLQTHNKVNSLKNGHLYKKSLFAFSNNGIDSQSVIIKSYAYQVDDFSLVLDNNSILELEMNDKQ